MKIESGPYQGGVIELGQRLDFVDPPHVAEYEATIIMPDGRQIEGVVLAEDPHTSGAIYIDTFETSK